MSRSRSRRRPGAFSRVGAAARMSSVARSPREGNVPLAPRIAVAGVVGALIIGILVLRLWALTVIGGAEYAARADSNVIRRLPVEAPRGNILDRSGRRPIVVSKVQHQVVLDLQDVDPKQLPDLVTRLGKVLAPNRFEVLKTTNDLRSKVANAPVGSIEPLIIDHNVEDDAIIHYLAEHQTDFPGVDVRETYARSYIHGSVAAHVLGQIGIVSQDELDTNKALQPIDHVGRSGLESHYDGYLRGIDGYNAVQVDASGVRSDAPGVRGLPASSGRNLVTTLDLPLQKATESALARGVIRAQGTAKGRDARAGAAVAIDPKTGEVLALASYPTFDPNIFTSSKPKDQATVKWLYSKYNKKIPMLDRAIAGTYPPGSIFKPITAIAAMDKGWITPDTPIDCPGAMPIMGTIFKNHEPTPLGRITLGTALETSCDTYFYSLAIRFFNDPKSPLQDWSRRFGLGRPTNIDIAGEAGGVVPDPAWRRQTFTNAIDKLWKPGDSVNMSIGQGDLLVTPLQMTNVYATLANGGIVHTPHVAKSVQDAGGNNKVDLQLDKPVDLKIPPGDMAAILDGLKRVNNGPNGTGTAVFGAYQVPTAGKSGTAEKGTTTDLAWYCGFAPADDPTIAACAFIDRGGFGGEAAGPIVLDMFKNWFGPGGGNLLAQREAAAATSTAKAAN
jgi:penicillin-binding protein 2